MIDPSAATTSTTVYKILTVTMWAEATKSGYVSGSADDIRDGFIHLSSVSQVAGTLDKHFAGHTDLLLVSFDTCDLAPLLKWERSRGGELFPHYYGIILTRLARSLKRLAFDAEGCVFCEVGNS